MTGVQTCALPISIHDGDPTSDVLAVRYIEALTQIADGRATKIVVPTEFSGVLGAVTGIAEAMRPIDETQAESEAESVDEPNDIDNE